MAFCRVMPERGVGSAGHAGSDRGLPGAASSELTGSGGIAGWSSAVMPGSTAPAACPSAMSGAPAFTRPSRRYRPASSPCTRSRGSVRRSRKEAPVAPQAGRRLADRSVSTRNGAAPRPRSASRSRSSPPPVIRLNMRGIDRALAMAMWIMILGRRWRRRRSSISSAAHV